MTQALRIARGPRAYFHLPPFRPNYPHGEYTVERPMPATQSDIDQLKALLRWARAGSASSHVREQSLADALDRAIAYLQEPDERKNVVGFVLGALHQSMRRVNAESNIWITLDRDLQSWALTQIEQLLGGPFVPDPPKGRPS